ncbi:VOC family protein [Saxibacter everestensis]|uniref:VOC family protein n=1 Tax=Saxibacter everestensis TaxID=2909229 RepID=A0ABY8QRJ1_9MICO|nr:VOC family protein [Brevibacteriaceae bacterium ZFBP1038]
MALARFKDLCIDVNDSRRMTVFWSAALGLTPRTSDQARGADGSPVLLRGPTPQHGVWINTVPEPRTVKQRVHIDVHGASVAEQETLGARVLPGWGPFSWTVMADPEGGEYCLFEREHVPGYRLYELSVDSLNPEPIAAWWAGVFDATITRDSDGEPAVSDIPGAPFGSFVFGQVAEPKRAKNRIHWDVLVDDAGAIETLARKGAAMVRQQDDDIDWTVMADPDGNEFCVFVDG